MKILTLVFVLYFSLISAFAARNDDPRADAFGIAVQNLFFNTAEVDDRSYLLAGSNQYRTLWSRDFATSLPGAIASGKEVAAKDSLEVIYGFQREDGLFPRVVDNIHINRRVVLGLAGMSPPFEAPLKPWFITEYAAITVDQNALIPWAAGEYVARIKDRKFALRWFAATEKALDFIRKGWWKDGLMIQPSFSDWQDSIRREGRVAATNVFYNLALRRLSSWARFIGNEEKAKFYARSAELHRLKFEEFFWSEDKKMIINFEGNDHLAADANLLAVVHGMISNERARLVMETMRTSPLWKPMPGRATWPEYPASMKGKNLSMAGIPDYFDKMHWIWITALGARAEKAIGNRPGCRAIMDWLAQRISKDGTIHEVYDLLNDGQTLRPVKRAIYRAEEPFTWSSAMYLEASIQGC